MCARISGYAGAHNLAPSPENCVDFGRLKQKQEIALSPSFRVIPNNTQPHITGLMAAPLVFAKGGWAFWIHACQQCFCFTSWDEDRL